jgi:hypothetical protein
MSDHPKIDEAPGLIWKPRKEGWVAYWQARSEIVKTGFSPSTVRLWEGIEPSETDKMHLSAQCQRLQADMVLWSKGQTASNPAVFDGTLRTLINCYQTDPDSRYHKKRYTTRRNNDTLLRRISTRHGDERLSDIKGRTIHAWHAEWSDKGRMPATWQAIRGLLRVLFSFGFTMLDDRECDRLCRTMSEKSLVFETPLPNKHTLTAAQAAAVRATAREWFGWHCLALGQAIQFEAMLRQRDVIGEWVPLTEPGTSDVIWRGQKWIRGIRWSEIDQNMILVHVTSKRQKTLKYDLKLAPMVMEEFGLMLGIDPAQVTREMLPASGPIIRSTVTGMPYDATEYRRKWRLVADKAGIPKQVKNMHSRSGGITEAAGFGAPKEHIKSAATHSNISTTEGYIRGDVDADATANVARIRIAGRNKPKTE